ncbi:NAD-dependent epimerase/dehydratase family protein [Streptomyces sp. R17]|uniref:NAD-dependent epimerase/dehydratase family protein n=1 Tax=Streptomyces sp. R17 TaxID=3238626 RepID=A0AB39P1J6_9ACTN
MRVFLTGGSGFVGQHLIRRLRSEGHEVVALPAPPRVPRR